MVSSPMQNEEVSWNMQSDGEVNEIQNPWDALVKMHDSRILNG